MKKITVVFLCILLIFISLFTNAKALDIYVPLCFHCLANRESFVEFTVISSTPVEGDPEGMYWSGDYYYEIVLKIDNLLLDVYNMWLSQQELITTVIHNTSPLDEGQKYITFINEYSLDGRIIARVNNDRTITAIPTGRYFQDYNGFTVEELTEIIRTMVLTDDCIAIHIPHNDVLNFEVTNEFIINPELIITDVFEYAVVSNEGFVVIQFEMFIGIIITALFVNALIILFIAYHLKRRYTKRSE